MDSQNPPGMPANVSSLITKRYRKKPSRRNVQKLLIAKCSNNTYTYDGEDCLHQGSDGRREKKLKILFTSLVAGCISFSAGWTRPAGHFRATEGAVGGKSSKDLYLMKNMVMHAASLDTTRLFFLAKHGGTRREGRKAFPSKIFQASPGSELDGTRNLKS